MPRRRLLALPLDAEALHLFEVLGKRFAFDVHGCTFLEVDAPMEEALRLACSARDQDALREALTRRHGGALARSLVGELGALVAGGHLFTTDPFGPEPLPPAPGVATVSVNISQKCNLACTYCFADGGSFGRSAMHMSPETARQTVDFLVEQAGPYEDLSVCFFGGEPLLNFAGVEEVVRYGRRRAAEAGKRIRFSVTTNGTRLTPRIRRFLHDQQFGVIVSVDGDQEVQDRMRPLRDGRGSYEQVRAGLDAAREERDPAHGTWTLRASFTPSDLEFSRQVRHLASLGFDEISVEPCVSPDEGVGVGWEEIDPLKREYTAFAREYLDEQRNGRRYSFFHFRVMLEQTRRGTQRLSQCGAGRGYLAVAAEGDIYPCHRLVGAEGYRLGHVETGITEPATVALFTRHHANSKPLCRSCWARYVCGGGCHACAIQFNGAIDQPYEVECELVKHRIELGAWLYSELAGDSVEGGAPPDCARP